MKQETLVIFCPPLGTRPKDSRVHTSDDGEMTAMWPTIGRYLALGHHSWLNNRFVSIILLVIIPGLLDLALSEVLIRSSSYETRIHFWFPFHEVLT